MPGRKRRCSSGGSQPVASKLTAGCRKARREEEEWDAAVAAWDSLEEEHDDRHASNLAQNKQQQRGRRPAALWAALSHRATQQRRRGHHWAKQPKEELAQRGAAGVVSEWSSRAAVLRQQRLFSRRAERACWLSSSHNAAARLAVSSHGGDVVLSEPVGTQGWTTEWEQLVVGKGKGGAVLDLTFPQYNVLVTCGHDGAVRKHDVELATPVASLSTADLGSTTRPGYECDHWFTCLSPSSDARQLLAGCNQGFLTCLDGDCSLSGRYRLHPSKSKLTSIARHPQVEHIIATGASDRRLRIWDLRKLGQSSRASSTCSPVAEPLAEWNFDSSVNSVSWSPCGGFRLLVTAQQREVHVLEQPLLHGPDVPGAHTVVQHAHRFYQHLTPFRASWHPVSDRVMCIGRYPEKGSADRSQGIDMYTITHGTASASAGTVSSGIECQLSARVGTCVNGVQAGGCAWSPDGTVLASLTGHSVVVYSVDSSCSA